MKRKILVAIGLLVIALGTAGIVMAATAPKTAKACVNSNGALKLRESGSCPTGTTSITLIGRGATGTVRAYAHIRSNGNVDASRSWNVDASDVVTTIDGFWCFKGLGFTPDGAQVTLDYNGILNGQIPQATLIFPPDPSDCGLSSARAEVFTGLVDPGVFTSGEKLGFYIVFY